ncbi:hypothetical protein TNCT_261081 [Trichonephila clavata]|uniref:Uncharacterized protein n=1 Tax=Trichonephila clavata TaxID=2740835 RepID=A0A8X6J707_TRICU|nr:hypothetical protein TNCT_261081 [Trichonephila clavata]
MGWRGYGRGRGGGGSSLLSSHLHLINMDDQTFGYVIFSAPSLPNFPLSLSLALSLPHLDRLLRVAEWRVGSDWTTPMWSLARVRDLFDRCLLEWDSVVRRNPERSNIS